MEASFSYLPEPPQDIVSQHPVQIRETWLIFRFMIHISSLLILCSPSGCLHLYLSSFPLVVLHVSHAVMAGLVWAEPPDSAPFAVGLSTAPGWWSCACSTPAHAGRKAAPASDPPWSQAHAATHSSPGDVCKSSCLARFPKQDHPTASESCAPLRLLRYQRRWSVSIFHGRNIIV